MIRYNDWMSYSYDGVEYGVKNDGSIFSLHFNSANPPLELTYKEALYRNASIMRDSFNEPFDLCLSGGIDSEIVARVFKDLKIKHNTFIFRLEENINATDVTNAINLCNALNINYTIVDFNLKQFFESDAEHYASMMKTPRAGRLARLKWFEILDNIVVMCEGEPYWIRNSGTSDKPSGWSFEFSEDAYTNSRYTRMINKTAICDWYEYTPEIIWSHWKLPFVRRLIDDEFPKRLSSWSSRYTIHKNIWPDISNFPKLTGFEGTGQPGHMPDFMTEFQQSVLSKYTSKYIILDERQFKECLTGHQKF